MTYAANCQDRVVTIAGVAIDSLSHFLRPTGDHDKLKRVTPFPECRNIMLALVPPSQSLAPMPLGQKLLSLLRNCSDLEQFPLELVALLGKYWTKEICFVVLGKPGKNPRQTLVWYQETTHILDFTARFWRQGWVKRIQTHSGSLKLPPGLSDGENPQHKKKWKLTPTLSIASGLALCTTFQREINGLVLIGSPQVRHWSAEEIETLNDLQDALAIASHTFLTSPTKTEIDIFRGTAPRHLGKEESPIIKLWYDATRQQLEQQKEWNEQLIHNIVTIMSDQTRNPLATIRMGIEMLRKRPPSPENLQQRLDIIEQEWRKLNEINEKILKLRSLKFDHNSFYFQPIEIVSFVENFLQNQQTQSLFLSSDKQLTLATQWIESSPIIKIDIHFLEQVLQELIKNIEKFSSPQSTVKIEIKDNFILGKPRIEIHFTNYSRCISSKNLKYLFDPFYREQWVIDSAIPGVGLGLSIIKTVVEQLNGAIDVSCLPTDDPDLCLINFVLNFAPGEIDG